METKFILSEHQPGFEIFFRKEKELKKDRKMLIKEPAWGKR
jgi:hypothetical protein